jgi:hypothetical protein
MPLVGLPFQEGLAQQVTHAAGRRVGVVDEDRVVAAGAVAVEVGGDVDRTRGDLQAVVVQVGHRGEAVLVPPGRGVGAGVLDHDEVVAAVGLALQLDDAALEGAELAGDRGGRLVQPPLPGLGIGAGVGHEGRGVLLDAAFGVAVDVDHAVAGVGDVRADLRRAHAHQVGPRTRRGAGVRHHDHREADLAAADVIGLHLDQAAVVGVHVGANLGGGEAVVPPPAWHRVGAAVGDHAHGEARLAVGDRVDLEVRQAGAVLVDVGADLGGGDVGVRPPAGRDIDRVVVGRRVGIEGLDAHHLLLLAVGGELHLFGTGVPLHHHPGGRGDRGEHQLGTGRVGKAGHHEKSLQVSRWVGTVG